MPQRLKAAFAAGAALVVSAAVSAATDGPAAPPGPDAVPAGRDPAGAAPGADAGPSPILRITGPHTPIPPGGFSEPGSSTGPQAPGEAQAAALPEAGLPPSGTRPATLAEAVERNRGRAEALLGQEGRCLAKAVYWEAKGEPLSGQLAVAQVVLNRVESGRFGRGICAVVTAPGQFSFMRAGRIPEAPNRAAWQTARAVALLALEGGWGDVVGEATHFHATSVNPRWRLRRVAAIGNHIFYR